MWGIIALLNPFADAFGHRRIQTEVTVDAGGGLYVRLRWLGAPRSKIITNFNQVEVGVAQVDGTDCPHGAGAFDRTCFNGMVVRLQMRDHLLNRGFSDEAQVS
jgi:hypothetical protein